MYCIIGIWFKNDYRAFLDLCTFSCYEITTGIFFMERDIGGLLLISLPPIQTRMSHPFQPKQTK